MNKNSNFSSIYCIHTIHYSLQYYWSRYLPIMVRWIQIFWKKKSFNQMRWCNKHHKTMKLERIANWWIWFSQKFYSRSFQLMFWNFYSVRLNRSQKIEMKSRERWIEMKEKKQKQQTHKIPFTYCWSEFSMNYFRFLNLFIPLWS